MVLLQGTRQQPTRSPVVVAGHVALIDSIVGPERLRRASCDMEGNLRLLRSRCMRKPIYRTWALQRRNGSRRNDDRSVRSFADCHLPAAGTLRAGQSSIVTSCRCLILSHLGCSPLGGHSCDCRLGIDHGAPNRSSLAQCKTPGPSARPVLVRGFRQPALQMHQGGVLWLSGGLWACQYLSSLILAPSVHIAQIPGSPFRPKRGGSARDPWAATEPPSSPKVAVEAGARVGVTGWAFARRLGSFIHSSLWGNTRILHLHRDGQLYPPLSRHDPQQHRFLYPPPQIVSHARPVLNCAQPGLARSRLVLAPGPVRVKPLQGPRRAVGSCPFSGRIHCLSGCFK